MIRAVSIFLLLASPLCALPPWVNAILSAPPPAAGGGGPAALFTETFDSTGYDNAANWSEAGTPDEDYATSPAPLAGTYSLALLSFGHTATLTLDADEDELWVVMDFHGTSTTAGTNDAVRIRNSSNTDLLEFFPRSSTGLLGVKNGTVIAYSSTGIYSANTTYRIYLQFIKGTGSDGESRVYYESGGTRTLAAETTAGNATTQANKIVFIHAGAAPIIDSLTVYDTDPGDLP